MGVRIEPSELTSSGDRCLSELAKLAHQNQEVGTSRGAQTIISAATLVEGHAEWILRSLLSLSDIGSSRLGNAILSAVSNDMFRTWDSRLSWLHEGFDISIRGDQITRNFLTVVDVRNSLVHGNGNLTSLQANKIDKLVQLRKQLSGVLGIELSATRLILDTDSAMRSLKVSRDFVIHLDKCTVVNYPKIMLLSP